MNEVIYLDEYGKHVDSSDEIHAATDETTDYLATLPRGRTERIAWFRRTQFPYLINLLCRLRRETVLQRNRQLQAGTSVLLYST